MSAQWNGVTIDCADTRLLAAFYRDLCGFETAFEDDAYVALDAGEGAPKIGFQRVDNYQAPQWPEGTPQQFHLDLAVSDLSAGQKRAIELGGRVADVQPGDGKWIVMLDPSGHPFCLSLIK